MLPAAAEPAAHAGCHAPLQAQLTVCAQATAVWGTSASGKNKSQIKAILGLIHMAPMLCCLDQNACDS